MGIIQPDLFKEALLKMYSSTLDFHFNLQKIAHHIQAQRELSGKSRSEKHPIMTKQRLKRCFMISSMELYLGKHIWEQGLRRFSLSSYKNV